MGTAGKTFVLIAVAALCLGAFSAAAWAAKKKDTVVVFFTGSPTFNPGGQVKARGTLHTVTACKSQRVVKLQVVDANGAVITAIDEDVTPNTGGNWSLSGKLPTNLPAGTNSVRVKAKKPRRHVRLHGGRLDLGPDPGPDPVVKSQAAAAQAPRSRRPFGVGDVGGPRRSCGSCLTNRDPPPGDGIGY
jgi:hypothetical protein